MAGDVPCCGTKFSLYVVIIIGLVLFAGLMAGLTLGLMSLGIVDLEVLMKSGRPQDRAHAVDPDDAVPVRKMVIRKIPRVSENIPLYDILNEFQKGHSHIAVVYKDLNESRARLKELRDAQRGVNRTAASVFDDRKDSTKTDEVKGYRKVLQLQFLLSRNGIGAVLSVSWTLRTLQFLIIRLIKW